MRIRTGIALAGLTIILAGCGVEVLTVAATEAELQAQAATAAKRQLQYADQTVGRVQAEQAIASYMAEKGAYPPTLDALVPGYLNGVPRKSDGSAFGYDPVTGRLLDRPPAGPNPADMHKVEEIKAAIHQYGMATGYYPATLDVLAPQYLPAPPRTTDGQAFVYDNQNGYVGLPGAPPPPRVQGAPAAGSGPMGEVMTGIGMQQQLNANSGAATNAAGGAARRSIGGATTRQNSMAEEVLGWSE